ncbi:MAG: hypothetical protein HQ541_08600 [Mariniphaga sp.]|nr:hypothetical protein [Mariniphaga sp.]
MKRLRKWVENEKRKDKRFSVFGPAEERIRKGNTQKIPINRESLLEINSFTLQQ